MQIAPALLEIIDDPDPNADFTVPFSDPEGLIEIINNLEETNLFLIQ